MGDEGVVGAIDLIKGGGTAGAAAGVISGVGGGADAVVGGVEVCIYYQCAGAGGGDAEVVGGVSAGGEAQGVGGGVVVDEDAGDADA